MTSVVRTACRVLSGLMLCGLGAVACAQQLDAHFSCSAVRQDGDEAVTYADSAEMRINGDHIASFRWESDLYRSTHGFDCSIDESDGLRAEVHDEAPNDAPNDASKVLWRVTLLDPHAARVRRGYDFDRLPRCSIRLERDGDTLNVMPTCPALCGSRGNFTALSVNLKTGHCRYAE